MSLRTCLIIIVCFVVMNGSDLYLILDFEINAFTSVELVHQSSVFQKLLSEFEYSKTTRPSKDGRLVLASTSSHGDLPNRV